MKQQGWQGKTLKGKRVTYSCHETTPRLADITAQVEGTEHFHVQLDVPLPIAREEVEGRFVIALKDE